MAGVNGFCAQLSCIDREKTSRHVTGGEVDMPTATVVTAGVAATFFAAILIGLKPLIVLGAVLGAGYGLFKLFDSCNFGSSSSSPWSWSTSSYNRGGYYPSNYRPTTPSYGYNSNRGRNWGFTPGGNKMPGWKT